MASCSAISKGKPFIQASLDPRKPEEALFGHKTRIYGVRGRGGMSGITPLTGPLLGHKTRPNRILAACRLLDGLSTEARSEPFF